MGWTVCQRVMQYSPVISYCGVFFSTIAASEAAIWECLIVLLNTFTASHFSVMCYRWGFS